jgi:hypothetical protein
MSKKTPIEEYWDEVTRQSIAHCGQLIDSLKYNKPDREYYIGVDYDFRAQIGSYCVVLDDSIIASYTEHVLHDEFESRLKALTRSLDGRCTIIRETT